MRVGRQEVAGGVGCSGEHGVMLLTWLLLLLLGMDVVVLSEGVEWEVYDSRVLDPAGPEPELRPIRDRGIAALIQCVSVSCQ